MNQITPEYLLQIIGELIVENKLLRLDLIRTQNELLENKRIKEGEIKVK